jgi:adenylosuccinate lyase
VIERYSRPEMAAIWTDERKLAIWQEIEALVLEGWADTGSIPADAATAARAAVVDPDRWRAREAEIHHDVAAFVDVMAEAMPDHGRWLHYGLTSSDLLDTALGVQMHEAGMLIAEGVIELFEVVRDLAVGHRNTAMIGRTHGMWAEPTTFGHKLAGYAIQLVNAHRRVLYAVHTSSYSKVSGAVGTHSTIPPTVEHHVVGALGLNAEPAATQVVSRDRHAVFVSALAQLMAVLERMAVEIRHLQRSEVAEAAEPFAEAQKGSSAMPHKHNPILAENITGMARLVRGYAATALENVALWHERDISHSSVERIVLPDACLVTDFALARMRRVFEGLIVDADRMRARIDDALGTVYSQQVLLALIRTGMERDAAYRIVQEASSQAIGSGRHLREVLEEHADASLDAAALDEAFDLDRMLAHAGDGVDHVAMITAEWMRSRPAV